MSEGCEEVESAVVLQKKASVLIRACCIPKIVKIPELAGSREHTTLRRLDYVCQQQQLLPPPTPGAWLGQGDKCGDSITCQRALGHAGGDRELSRSCPRCRPAATVKQLGEDSGIALPPLSTFCISEHTARDRIT